MAAGGRDYSSDDYSIPEFDAASPYYAFFGAGVEEPAEPTPAFSFFGSLKKPEVSTRILGRRTAPFQHFRIPYRAPRVYPKLLVLTPIARCRTLI